MVMAPDAPAASDTSAPQSAPVVSSNEITPPSRPSKRPDSILKGESDGLSDLMAGFSSRGDGDAGKGAATPSDISAKQGTEAPTPAKTEATGGDTAQQSTPSAGREAPAPSPSPFDPALRTQIARDAIAQYEAEQRAKAQAAQLSQMSDAEYGAYARQWQAKMAEAQSIHEVAMADFYKQGAESLIERIPELANIKMGKAQKLHPSNYQNYPDMISAWVDHVVESRSKAHIKAEVEKQVEAFKADYLAKAAGKFPTVSTPANPGALSDINDSMSGTELLYHAFK